MLMLDIVGVSDVKWEQEDFWLANCRVNNTKPNPKQVG